jgi:prophage DNA circulation protein
MSLIPPLWALQLQPASFRGIPFQVTESEITRGRRGALHEYPGSNSVYFEDLGRSKQELAFSGFLVGDDCYKQRDKLAAACDQAGRGNLVHPSIGSVQANLLAAGFGENAMDGRMVAVSLRFIVGGDINFPSLFPKATNSQQKKQGTLATITSAIKDFVAKVSSYIDQATAYVSSAISAAGAFLAPILAVAGVLGAAIGLIGGVISLASSAIGAVKGISLGVPDVSLGRYSQGNITSPTQAPGGSQSAAATLATATAAALSAACAARAAVVQAAALAQALAGARAPTFPQSVADLIEATRATINDPGDQIKALVPLAAFAPTVTPSSSTASIPGAIATAQIATGALIRRCTLASIANAVTVYNPTSSTEVQALIDRLVPLFDAEILFAADNDDLNSYLELRLLRTQTISNLQALGSQLPALITIKRPLALPSLLLSQQLYQTASRSDDLIRRSNAINPCFLPTEFTALSA